MEYSKVKVLSCNDVSLKATGNPGTLEHWGEAEQRTSDWRPCGGAGPRDFQVPSLFLPNQAGGLDLISHPECMD